MSKSGKSFADLAERARGETAPVVDVADRVIESIRPRIEPPSPDWPLWCAAALSVAAALAMMVFAVQQELLVADPLTELMSPLIPTVQ
jgi:hypothetical protein